MKTIIRYIEDQILAFIQRRCDHPGNMVAADILEGCFDGLQIKYCRRCGSIKTVYEYGDSPFDGDNQTWRRPDPNLHRDMVADIDRHVVQMKNYLG